TIHNFINLSCNLALPRLIAATAMSRQTAVNPLIVAYIEGKKYKGSTSKPIRRRLIPNSAATAKGTTMDNVQISPLYFFSSSVIAILLLFYLYRVVPNFFDQLHFYFILQFFQIGFKIDIIKSAYPILRIDQYVIV